MITKYPEPTVVVIDYVHNKTHEGRFFSGGYYSASVADGATIDLLVQTSANNTFHCMPQLTAAGDSTLVIYEGTTVSSAGTAIALSNHNRSSAKTTDMTVTHTPTVTGSGTQVNGTVYIPAGRKGGGGAENSFSNEFILKISTIYLLRGTNNSGGAIKMDIELSGYHPLL